MVLTSYYGKNNKRLLLWYVTLHSTALHGCVHIHKIITHNQLTCHLLLLPLHSRTGLVWLTSEITYKNVLHLLQLPYKRLISLFQSLLLVLTNKSLVFTSQRMGLLKHCDNMCVRARVCVRVCVLGTLLSTWGIQCQTCSWKLYAVSPRRHVQWIP